MSDTTSTGKELTTRRPDALRLAACKSDILMEMTTTAAAGAVVLRRDVATCPSKRRRERAMTNIYRVYHSMTTLAKEYTTLFMATQGFMGLKQEHRYATIE